MAKNGTDYASSRLPWPELEPYFQLKSTSGKNVVVSCKLCPPGPRTYSANIKANSNLKKHMEVGTG